MDLIDEEGSKVGDDTKVVVVRLLTGALSGCEFAVGPGVTLFVQRADSELASAQGMVDFPPNVIVIPSGRDDDRNFEIDIDPADLESCLIRELGDEVREERLTFQSAGQVGALRFCVKRLTDEWCPELLGIGTPEALPVPTKVKGVSATVIVCGFAGILFVLSLVLWTWIGTQRNDAVAGTEALMTGARGTYQVLQEFNSPIVRVFADTDRDASWGRQAVARRGLANRVKVSTVHAEEIRVHKLIQETFPGVVFHRLQLNDAEYPRLMISEERTVLSPETRRALIGKLQSWMPYATTVQISSWKDSEIEDQAAASLDRLGLKYVRESTGNGVVFRIVEYLGDADWYRFQRLISEFNDNFGSRYIEFSAKIKDDWLKEKSYKYGDSGYVKLAPRHWLFPNAF